MYISENGQARFDSFLQGIRYVTNEYSSYGTFLKPHGVIFTKNVYLLFSPISTLYHNH